MESCESCRKNKVCKWKEEAAKLSKAKIDMDINLDSPFSIVLYCTEFEKNVGIRQ